MSSSSSSSPFRRWDPVDDAVRLLGLPTTGRDRGRGRNRPSREDIERAFRTAAKKYHPDRQHDLPDALRFRQCLEARNLLLDRFHRNGGVGQHAGGRAQRARPEYEPPQPPRARYRPHGYASYTTGDGVFAKGFPFQTLHLLTTRSKIIVKGATGILILGLGMYDGYRRHQNKSIARDRARARHDP
eukprot:jgi/Psemu1/291847/fgenesh1_pg.828_\